MSMIALGDTPPVHFQAKVCTYNFGYFYPKWQTFMKPVVRPSGKKQIQFHNAQAVARKDVERAFRILQA
jgi:hypothetical protein